MDYIEFKGIKSSDLNVVVTDPRTLRGATPDISFIQVPGRSGDLIQDNNRYQNYDDAYVIGLDYDPIKTLEEQIIAVRNWLSGLSYDRLFDSKFPSYYRKAVCTTSQDVDQSLRDFGQATASFNCKPFRNRIDGDTVQTLTAPGTITNPEQWESSPYVKITGSGDITLQINDQSVVLTGVSDTIEIDSELQSCFKGLVLQNSHYRSDFWPVLNIGGNQISWTGSVSKVEITPRWRTL
jgi:phage-related protein